MPLFKSDLNSDRGICNSVSHKGFTRNKHPEKLYLYTLITQGCYIYKHKITGPSKAPRL